MGSVATSGAKDVVVAILSVDFCHPYGWTSVWQSRLSPPPHQIEFCTRLMARVVRKERKGEIENKPALVFALKHRANE